MGVDSCHETLKGGNIYTPANRGLIDPHACAHVCSGSSGHSGFSGYGGHPSLQPRLIKVIKSWNSRGSAEEFEDREQIQTPVIQQLTYSTEAYDYRRFSVRRFIREAIGELKEYFTKKL